MSGICTAVFPPKVHPVGSAKSYPSLSEEARVFLNRSGLPKQLLAARPNKLPF